MASEVSRFPIIEQGYNTSATPQPVTVIVPYVKLHPEVPRALERDGIVLVHYVDTSFSDDAYWRLLGNLWWRGKSFIVLEQDKVPAPGALRELWDCPQPWCTFPVTIANSDECATFPTLSCTKFSSTIISHKPELFDEIAEYDYGYGKCHWNRLDFAIYGLIDAEVHWHEKGRVTHLHQETGND